jgi:hypothetical protein
MFQSNEQQSAYSDGIVYVGMRKQEKARVECLLSLLPRVKQVVRDPEPLTVLRYYSADSQK